jgi:hypothetical protein
MQLYNKPLFTLINFATYNIKQRHTKLDLLKDATKNSVII